ncbi:major facilitator superfamily domain-containing protein [Xylariales sp. PMI_506]|nr:major facilitator superfamily domain-containing protein [Xylariales sp. PMI_506]
MRSLQMPTPNPKDPLNLSEKRKWLAIGILCFFGSLALSAEIIIGSMIPVFLLEYSGVDPRILSSTDFAASADGININLFAVLPPGVIPADLGQISLLATVPLITNGIASYLLVPLSIAIGRRPVLVFTAAMAWIGGLWAGLSSSLTSHIAARAMQGLGAGAVEALIPLIVGDIMFLHKRNKAMSAVISSQGLFIIALGLAGPYVAAHYTWRILYFATSGFGVIAWLLLIFYLPETRWERSKEELSGQTVYSLAPGAKRPELDIQTYGERTLWDTIGFFQFGFQWKKASRSMLDTLWTMWFPAIVWTTLANSVFVIINQAAQQLAAFALLAQGIPFEYTGISVIPNVVATAAVYFIGGALSDRISLWLTRRKGGVREAEYHLPNLVLPFISGIAGCFIFGWAGQNDVHWIFIMLGAFFIIFGFLTVLTVFNVYVVESYPMWAGPVLVNVSSIRVIIGFFLSSNVTVWVQEMGIESTFALYAESIIIASLGIPILFFWGKRIRVWTAGSVRARGKQQGSEGKLEEKSEATSSV